jgi:hypothetical protein
MYVYDDAQVNVLEEALPFQMDHKNRGIRRKIMNLKCKNYDLWIHLGWFKHFPKFMFSIKL